MTQAERDQAIVELAAQGISYEEIGEKFGLTRSRIQQIARKFGLHRRTSPPPWPVERTQAMQALQEEGLSPGEIAGQLGVSRNAVLGKLFRTRRWMDSAHA